jgi:Fe2+ or Zn2+ uptake regulation protein
MENVDLEKRMAEFRIRLKKHGLKVTQQRYAVHEAMLKLGHASADMVTEEIVKEGKTKVTVASVYNILTLLAGLGIYGRRSARGGKMVFDGRVGPHLHLYDTESEAWRDLEDEEMMKWLEAHLKGKRYRGYRIDGFEVQLLCRPSRKGPVRKL